MCTSRKSTYSPAQKRWEIPVGGGGSVLEDQKLFKTFLKLNFEVE